MPISPTQASYESTRYPHYIHASTDPARLAALGRIFGVRAADPNAARVLEIGCGAGSNLLAMAARLPGSRFLGVDFAASDIDSAVALAAEAGLDNAEFLQCDLLTWQPGAGTQFDFIIAWGVFSWVPWEVKDRLLAVCRECLAPAGIACISYMTYPGCKQAESLRDLLFLRTGGIAAPAGKIAAAHQTLDFLDRACAALPPTMAHTGFLRSEIGRIREKEECLLLHDELEVNRDPFYVLQFTGWAGKHQLRYLGDADFHTMLLENLPAETARELAAMKLSHLETEQMIDYAVNRSFRATLLAGLEATDGVLHPEALRQLCFKGSLQLDGPWTAGDADGHFRLGSGQRVTLHQPTLIAFLRALAERPAAYTPFGDLVLAAQSALTREFTEIEKTRLSKDLLALYGRQQVEISARPFPPPVAAPPCPRLTPLNAALARRRGIVSTASHDAARLSEPERACCALLDGARERPDLMALTGWPAQQLETFLQGLARGGCLAP